MTARALWKRQSLQAGLFAIPMAPLAAAYLGETLALDAAGWRYLVGAVGILVGPLFVVGSWWQRRMARVYLDWLDGVPTCPPGTVLLHAIQLPLRIMLAGIATWVAGGALIVVVGLMRVSDFGLFESIASIACASGAGLVSGFFTYSNWKRLTRTDMRRLVAEAGPEARERCEQRVSLLSKLQLAFLSTGMMPLLLAIFLVQSRTAELLAPLLSVAAASAIFSIALAWAIAREVTDTTTQLAESLSRVASGDLREPTWIETDDELGAVARASDRLVARLREALEGLSSTTDAVERATEGLEHVSRTVVDASGATTRDVARAAGAVGGIDEQGRGIASQAEALTESVHGSVSSISELSSTGTEVHELAARVAAETDTSVAALEQIAASAGRIAVATGQLTESAQAASHATVELEASVRGIDERASAAESIAGQVAELSERGRLAVASVRHGVERIDASVAENDRVAAALRARVDDIGSVIHVIDEVAGTTQLLSLNAAIIAAQAGDRGRAFGVVAGEVKQLANRVSEQTREIEAIIAAIGEAASDAASATESTRRAVSEGAHRASEAGKVLEEISSAAAESGAHASAIGGVLAEHSQGARHLLGLVGTVAEGVERIARDADEQLRSQGEVVSSAEAVREAAQSVHRSTEEQSRSLTMLRDGADAVEQGCQRIHQALEAQTADSEHATSLLEEVSSHAAQNAGSAERLATSIAELRERSAAMRALLERFTV